MPLSYEIEIAPDLEVGSFTGRMRAGVRVERPVTRVVLHAAQLTITEPRVDGRAARAGSGEGAEQLALELDGELPAGESTVEMGFAGGLDGDLRGFYRCRFVAADGVERLMAATDFEPTNARRAFPCWDEPDLKATFTVSVVVPPGSTALSSGPVESEETLPGGHRRVRFAETMPMSTYVLAWVVGPLEATGPLDVDGVPLRIVAPSGRLGLTRYALEAAYHALSWLAGYFHIPYPAAKLDHVAIPDFASGAMENVGCVTYRESLLLADPDRSSQAELQAIVETVTHETAHMWFGNLATMRWWNGLWLNEAFATFMERKGTDAFRPDWDVWSSSGRGRAEALAVDGLTSTRPVEYPVVAPDDAEDMFDSLTYDKGGALLRMLEQHLGEETFRRGISRYLSEHAYGNAETTDLWDALEAESGSPVRDTMDGWILRPGHPLVTALRGADPATLELSQERFCYGSPVEGSWKVPLALRASVAGEIVERRVLLEGPRAERFGGPVDWVVVNGGGFGFHRSATDLSLLPPDLAVCTPLERLTLVDDAWASTLAGAPPGIFVRLLRRLGDDSHPDVWAVAAGALRMLDRVAAGAERPRVAGLVQEVAGPAWGLLGWEPRQGEPAAHATTRATLVHLLGGAGGDLEVRTGAARRFADHLGGTRTLDADLLGSVAAVVAAGGGMHEWHQIAGALRAAATPQDRQRHLHALAAFEAAELARAALELAISAEVRPQEQPVLVAGVLAGRQGAEIGWPWFEEHAEQLAGRLPPRLVFLALSGVSRIPDAVVAGRVHAWLADHPLPTSRRWVDQLEERLDLTVGLARRLEGSLAAAFAER